MSNQNIIVINEYFLFKLVEFYNKKNNNKFVYGDTTVKFKDKTCMGTWFINNKKKIKNSTDGLARKVWLQYEEYIKERYYNNKERKMLKYKNKLKEFANEPDLEKFKEDSIIEFSDGKKKGTWFRINKEIIFKSIDVESIKIIKQYEEYIKEKNNNIEIKKANEYKKKLDALANEPDLEKFKEGSKIKFKDKTCMGTWFINNKKKIKNSTDGLARKVWLQYEEYIKERDYNNKERKMLKYKNKLKEFANEPDLEKFKKGSTIKFKDGTYMEYWFSWNKKELENSTDRLGKIIWEQYEQYKKIEIWPKKISLEKNWKYLLMNLTWKNLKKVV